MSVKFLLRDKRIRQNLIDYINQQPLNAEFPLIVTFSDPDRTLSQNSLFHALCGDVSKQLQWAGKRRNLSEWKALFVSGHAVATGKPGEVVPGLEGEFCAIRESTAKMGIKRMSSLIEYSQAYAVGNGVQLRDVRYSLDYFGRMA
ncbi:recombination protein NinB [Kosakonia oryziphila]|uniref:NinB protein n=1 Tax=Kosakonia oryziphila TaxID=1005667 RepID=A0A1C4GBU4_9ENTR|nr:recombination protein NinB [Kosakonia oryziphila]SCC65690.1 NinB protein [Kosakonia oryziphila]